MIHPDQVDFVGTCSSINNIRRLIDIMWTSQNEASPAAALSLDAGKAFDRVERYPRASVATNGIISQPLEIHRGTRQGCMLSPPLCVLVLEPLAAPIRRDPDWAKSEALPLTPYCPMTLFQPGDFTWLCSGIKYRQNISTYVLPPLSCHQGHKPTLLSHSYSGYGKEWLSCLI